MKMKVLGKHLILELYDCNPERLKERHIVENIMLTAAQEAGANVIGTFFHQFKPYGVSGVIIITESHFSVHTWYEYGYAAVDVFVCGNVDLGVAVKELVKGFEAGMFKIKLLPRGIVEA